jgi:hypothetical protein
MGKRGPRSAAALAVASPELSGRSEPPDRLTPAEAELWCEVVAARPRTFFEPAVLPLLEAYVTAVIEGRALAADMAATPRNDLKARALLLKSYDVATRVALAHARSLRITTQSRISKNATEQLGPMPGQKPWDHVPLHLRDVSPRKLWE